MHVKSLNPQYLKDKKGKNTMVVLPVQEYDQLLEDLHDLSIMAERREENGIPFDEFKQNLKKDGYL